MYAMEMVEGKDHPREIPKDDTHSKGTTPGLLLRLTRALYSSGKVLVLDSGFCVFRAILELMKVGVYAGALIKKRRY